MASSLVPNVRNRFEYSKTYLLLNPEGSDTSKVTGLKGGLVEMGHTRFDGNVLSFWEGPAREKEAPSEATFSGGRVVCPSDGAEGRRDSSSC